MPESLTAEAGHNIVNKSLQLRWEAGSPRTEEARQGGARRAELGQRVVAVGASAVPAARAGTK